MADLDPVDENLELSHLLSQQLREARQYLTHLVNLLTKEEFDDDEERSLLVEKAHAEVCKTPVLLSNDGQGSVSVEYVLARCTLDQLLAFLDAYTESWRRVCCGLYASRVVEYAFSRVYTLVKDLAKDDSSWEKLEATLAVAVAELVGTRGCLPLFFNVHGCHPMRGLIRLLGGCAPEVGGGRKPLTLAEKKKAKKRKKKRNATEFAYQQEEQKDSAPVLEFSYRRPALMEAISEIQKNICSTTDDDLADLVSDSSAAPTLQILLRVSAGLDIQSPFLLARLIGVPPPDDERFADPVAEADVSFLTSFCRDGIASHTMEAIVSTCCLEVYDKLVTDVFLPSIKSLSKHRTANFVVQRLVERSSESPEHFTRFMGVFNEEIPKLMTISPGVVVAIVKTSAAVKLFQQEIYDGLCSISGVMPHFAAGLLMFRVKGEDRLSYHGAMVLIHLLDFNQEIASQIFTSIMRVPENDLLRIAESAFGTRVLDAIMSRLPDEVKAGFVYRLFKHFSKLACTKFGSRWVDRCFDEADFDLKERIVESLADYVDTLEADLYGRFVAKNCELRTYLTRYEEWGRVQRRRCVGKRLFKDVLGEQGSMLSLESVRASNKAAHAEARAQRAAAAAAAESEEAATDADADADGDPENLENADRTTVVEADDDGQEDEKKPKRKRKRKRSKKSSGASADASQDNDHAAEGNADEAVEAATVEESAVVAVSEKTVSAEQTTAMDETGEQEEEEEEAQVSKRKRKRKRNRKRKSSSSSSKDAGDDEDEDEE